MPVKKINVNEVEIGMYVSRLDRPWSETPFLFQGFPVRNKAEIAELKKQCQHVYIMVPDEEIEISAIPARPKPQPASELIGKKQYKTTSTAMDEIRTVKQSHEELVGLMRDVETAFRQTGQIKLDLIEESVEVMIDSIGRNPDAYIWLNRIKKFDSYIYRDALNASILATTVGRELGLARDKLNALATGALVMDIGKTKLPPELLNKKERLTDNEWAIMKTHVEHGVRTLSEDADASADVLDIVRTHHERLDGSGYPAALKGDHIPLLGQIAGMVDFYVALTTPRPYANATSASNAAYMLYQQQGVYFSEMLVKHFIQALSTYPTGSLVELSSGEVGIVVSQNPGLRLRPNVVLLLDPKKEYYGSFTVVSLVDYCYGNTDKPVTVAKTLPDGAYGVAIEEMTASEPAED
ncbi:HD-GYP domain-containing protein [Gilvimarinus sp. F26214L]|uniref:HD-GYP domain-containing protein n=1 Tax=Gilvimarinus sp. DZF01 TaxID=3461371 RepID=UPI00404543AD